MKQHEFIPENKKTAAIPASTPRNFVAKNMKSSGAGAHSDKKRNEKHGVEKHKKDYMAMAEATDKKAKQVAALEKKIAAANDALGLARERRKMKAQRLQGQREIDLAKKISDLRQELHSLKNSENIAEGISWTALGDDISAEDKMRIIDEYYSTDISGNSSNVSATQRKSSVAEGAKVDRQAQHIAASMEKQGKSPKEAEGIAWAHVKHPSKKSVNEETAEENPSDTITLDVPLMIRLMEYAREDASTDVDLHKVAEKLVELSEHGSTLGMQEYDTIISHATSAEELQPATHPDSVADLNEQQALQRIRINAGINAGIKQ